MQSGPKYPELQAASTLLVTKKLRMMAIARKTFGVIDRQEFAILVGLCGIGSFAIFGGKEFKSSNNMQTMYGYPMFN